MKLTDVMAAERGFDVGDRLTIEQIAAMIGCAPQELRTVVLMLRVPPQVGDTPPEVAYRTGYAAALAAVAKSEL
jgi:hypothetical protein